MKIVILGSGAMGCLYGGLLAENGNDVTFVDVVDATIEKINRIGVTLETDSGKRDIPSKACTAADLKTPPDLVILFTKTVFSRAALDSVKHVLDASVIVLTIQNGLGNKEIIQEYVNENRIIIGMTGYPADLRGPADVVSHGTSFTSIVAANGKVDAATATIAGIISEAGLNCAASSDALHLIWEKVCFNSAVNSLCAVSGLTVGEVGEFGGREIAYDIAAEGVAVARAYGIPASFDKVRAMLDHAFASHYGHKPSMLQDVLNKRRTEVDSLNGALAERGEKMNIPVSINRTMRRLVAMIQDKYLRDALR